MTPAERRQDSPLWELTKARLRELFREKGVLFWVFAFPLLMAIGLGLAFRSRPLEAPRIAVVAPSASKLAQALDESERVQVVAGTRQGANQALSRGKVDLVVDLSGGRPRLRYDAHADQGVRARWVVEDVMQRAAGRRDPVRIDRVAVTEPGSRYIDFLLPGLIALNLMGTSMWGVGYSLVVARKRRLLRRYAVTPMRRSHFLLSFFFSRGMFLVLEVGALLVFGVVAFHSVVVGSVLAVYALAFLGAAAFAAISLVIGARVENTESANGWMNFVQLPMWVLSGVLFSYERFPEWLHPAIRALPLTALVDALRAIVNQGASLLSCWPQIAVLLGWTAAGFAVSLRTFRWQ